MKELENYKSTPFNSPASGGHAEVRPVVKKKFVGTVVLNPGQKLFEYEIESGKMEEMKPDEISATIDGGVKVKMTRRAGCIYIAAINKRNAFRKVVKQIVEREPACQPNTP